MPKIDKETSSVAEEIKVELSTQDKIDAVQAEMNALAAEVETTQDVDKRAKFFNLKALRNELRTQL